MTPPLWVALRYQLRMLLLRSFYSPVSRPGRTGAGSPSETRYALLILAVASLRLRSYSATPYLEFCRSQLHPVDVKDRQVG
jgi:hypothetical protein